MHRQIGIGQPQNPQRRAVVVVVDHAITEPFAERHVACRIMADHRRFVRSERATARPERPGPVHHVTVPVGILEIGRPRRDIRRNQRTTMRGQPFGQCPRLQGPHKNRPKRLDKRRRANIVDHRAPPAGQAHGIAMKPVRARPAAGRDRRGTGAGGGGEIAGMVVKPATGIRETGKVGTKFGSQEIVPVAIGDEQDGAAGHGITPLMAASKISQTRAPLDRRAAISGVSGCDSRNGTCCSANPPCERSRVPASCDRS